MYVSYYTHDLADTKVTQNGLNIYLAHDHTLGNKGIHKYVMYGSRSGFMLWIEKMIEITQIIISMSS